MRERESDRQESSNKNSNGKNIFTRCALVQWQQQLLIWWLLCNRIPLFYNKKIWYHARDFFSSFFFSSIVVAFVVTAEWPIWAYRFRRAPSKLQMKVVIWSFVSCVQNAHKISNAPHSHSHTSIECVSHLAGAATCFLFVSLAHSRKKTHAHKYRHMQARALWPSRFLILIHLKLPKKIYTA